jgi:Tfp pilus assembly protein PilP
VLHKASHRVMDSSDSPHVVHGLAASAARGAGIGRGIALVVAALAGLETATLAAEPPPAKPAPAVVTPAPAPERVYNYETAGRRDPFVSLDRASDPKASARSRLAGLAGISIHEATVKGVVKSEGQLLAMVQAPDNKTYIVRANDRLLDGAVRAITPEAVVFVQQVNDPLSPVKQREIRKPLRPIEEGK